jgi:hypothetical protein
MGGYGSGRYRWLFAKPTTSSMLSLDVRELLRAGFLVRGCRGFARWTWSDNRTQEPAGQIAIVMEEDGVATLVYRHSQDGDDWEHIRERVGLDRTPQHYGGERVWWRCPTCTRRCAILYGGPRFLCRKCHGLVYASSAETLDERMARKAERILARLGVVDGGLLTAFPPKPPRMRHATYQRLELEFRACRYRAFRELGLLCELSPR